MAEQKQDKGAAAKKGGKDANKAPPPIVKEPTFVVQPSSWDIPPHEYRFVNVFFNPRELTDYRGIFSAKVADAVDPANKYV